MLILGLLALIQIVWLPGLILRRAFRVDLDEPIGRAVVTFGLSLIANTVLVTLLTACGLYTRTVLAVVMAAELVALAAWRSPSHGLWRRGVDLTAWRDLLAPSSSGQAAAAVLALATVAIMIQLSINNWGTVFSANDDVASWNRWAQEWAQGVLPTRASWYPQLLPANWSISYVLLGRTDIKLFAKTTTTLFPLATVCLFLSLALVERRTAFLWGTFLCGVVLLHNLGPAFLQLGYADVPLAFFGFLAFYAARRSATAPSAADAIALSLVAAAGTILTKQGGVYALVAAVAFAAWIARQDPASALGRASRSARAVMAAIMLFTVAWYGYKALQIRAGTDYTNLTLLTQGLHEGRSWLERLVVAVRRFASVRGPGSEVVQAACAVLIAGSVVLRETRPVTLLLIVPFLLAWGLWFSYEVRNAALAFPFVAFVAGITVDRWTAPLARAVDRLTVGSRRLAPMGIALLLFAGAVWALAVGPIVPAVFPDSAAQVARNPWVSEAWQLFAGPVALVAFAALVGQAATLEGGRVRLWWPAPAAAFALAVFILMQGDYRAEVVAGKQLALQKRIGDPAVNERLYAAFDGAFPKAPVLTDYWFLKELPGLESTFRGGNCGDRCTLELLGALAAAQPDLGYFLLHEATIDDTLRAALSRSTTFRTVFLQNGIRFIAIDRSGHAFEPVRPTVAAAPPIAGAGRLATLRVSARHDRGGRLVSSVILRIEPPSRAASTCYFQWYRGTGTVSIANDDGVGWADERALGQAVTIRNGACEVDLGASRAEVNGPSLDMLFAVRFSGVSKGAHAILVDAVGDDGLESGLQRAGTWNVD